MLEKLMPKSDAFFDDFEGLAAEAVEATHVFHTMMKEWDAVAARCLKIKEIEHRADDITHRAFERLHTQFITPFDRADIHRLLSRIDDVVDLTDAAAERLQLYEVGVVLPDAVELAGVLVGAVDRMQQAVKGLRNLKDTGRILQACREVNEFENRGDTLVRRALADLFHSQHDPITVMKWKEILDYIENGIDRAEDVANVIEGVVLEHA